MYVLLANRGAVLTNYTSRRAVDQRNEAGDLVYLASPYTHPDREMRQWRFRMATIAAATLIKRGKIVYSPITMTHPLDVVLAGSHTTLGSDYWVDFDEAFMRRCSEMVILKLKGWENSSGIKREMEFFRSEGKPISYMEPDELDENLVSTTMRQDM